MIDLGDFLDLVVSLLHVATLIKSFSVFHFSFGSFHCLIEDGWADLTWYTVLMTLILTSELRKDMDCCPVE